MPMLDIFRSDAFSTTVLTDAILKAPFKPSAIGALGLFRERGIPTTSVVIEEKDGRLSLIQTSPRGTGNPSSIGENKRTARSFLVPHLERETQINADQIQGVRAFGSMTEQAVVMQIVNERLADLKAMHEVTLEHMRAGAIQGQVLDADGSVLLDLFTEFGVVQQTAEITIGGDTRSEVVAILRLIEDELGADPVSGYRAFCGDDFFDTLIELDAVKDSLKYQESVQLRTDLRAGFQYGGVTFVNYRGKTGGTPFFPAGKAYVFPEASNLFATYFAPADFIETVNTIGLPMYAKQVVDDELNRFVRLHTQSNPLSLCLRPRAVVEVEIGT